MGNSKGKGSIKFRGELNKVDTAVIAEQLINCGICDVQRYS